ncbi:MAG TPA: allantoate amidohydrolase [Catenuloplanes sp.]
MTAGPDAVAAFERLWAELAPVGRDPASGGYLRYAFTAPELRLRDWFSDQADRRDLAMEQDGNGNLIAWWGDPRAGDAVATGSHFDSVPHGGAYDGPLGIVSALLAVDALRAAGVTPHRPIALVVFAEEEGARFGVPCLGSRLLTGALDPASAAALTDRDGISLASALGADPAGARPDLLARIGAFVELHVEQGRALADLDAPVGVADAIWPHGRWRLEITGQGNHAGTTRMADRRDPMLTFAATVLAVDRQARLRGAHATIGRVAVRPNATNAVPSLVTGWLDARAADPDTLTGLVEAVRADATERGGHDGTTVTLARESFSPVVTFDPRLLAGPLASAAGMPGVGPPGAGVPVLPTGAGHDAGVLAAHVPTGMLFVRNPTGISHSPAEHATGADCAAGVAALATVLRELACR